MTATSYNKYEIGVKLYNERKEFEESFDDPFEEYDEFYTRLTPMEQAIWMFLEMGFTRKWIEEHFEVSRQAVSAHIVRIRYKLTKYLEEKGNEPLCDSD